TGSLTGVVGDLDGAADAAPGNVADDHLPHQMQRQDGDIPGPAQGCRNGLQRPQTPIDTHGFPGLLSTPSAAPRRPRLGPSSRISASCTVRVSRVPSRSIASSAVTPG